MKKFFIIIILIFFLGFGAWFLAKNVNYDKADVAETKIEEKEDEAIENLLQTRREEIEKDAQGDPFGEDGIVRILFLGLDKRVGESKGHCDAIQLVTVNKKRQEVTITAVPRGTYAPLHLCRREENICLLIIMFQKPARSAGLNTV